jgi:hypothetical protein
MITRPKTRKAPAASIDPIFAAIVERKALLREYNRCDYTYRTARDQAEKKHGWEWGAGKSMELLELAIADVKPLSDLWKRAANAERRAAMRMARTKPTTPQGAAALITHARREIVDSNCEDFDDWVPTALKTVAAALTRMEAA